MILLGVRQLCTPNSEKSSKLRIWNLDGKELKLCGSERLMKLTHCLRCLSVQSKALVRPRDGKFDSRSKVNPGR